LAHPFLNLLYRNFGCFGNARSERITQWFNCFEALSVAYLRQGF
jgi:hypothetical protein